MDLVPAERALAAGSGDALRPDASRRRQAADPARADGDGDSDDPVVTRIVVDLDATEHSTGPDGHARSISKRLRIERDGPQLAKLRAELAESGVRALAVTDELQHVIHQAQSREAWWRAGVQRMEAGVAEGALQQNRLVAAAEQNWEAQHGQLVGTVRAIESQAYEHIRREQEEAALHAEQARAAAANSENEAAALRRTLDECEAELGRRRARAEFTAESIRTLTEWKPPRGAPLLRWRTAA